MNAAPFLIGADGVITSLLAGHWVPSIESAVALVSGSSGEHAGGSGLLKGPPTGLDSDASWAAGLGSARPVRVARVGRLDEPEPGRAAVHGDRADRHVRARAGVGGLPLEVEAEAGQALRGAVGEHHPVAGQEAVRGRVVDQVHQPESPYGRLVPGPFELNSRVRPGPRRSAGRARALASGAAQLAARCNNTGAVRLPERSRSRDSRVPAPAVPAALADELLVLSAAESGPGGIYDRLEDAGYGPIR